MGAFCAEVSLLQNKSRHSHSACYQQNHSGFNFSKSHAKNRAEQRKLHRACREANTSTKVEMEDKKRERERNKLFIGGHVICYYGTTKWPSCPEGRPTYHRHTKTNKQTHKQNKQTNKTHTHTKQQQQQQQLLGGVREAHLETEELQEKVSGGGIITYNHNLQHIITRVAQ